MIKYEVVKGFVMDLKAREGHIAEVTESFDTKEEAEERFIRVQVRLTLENEYVALSEVEFDDGDWTYGHVYTVYNQDLGNKNE